MTYLVYNINYFTFAKSFKKRTLIKNKNGKQFNSSPKFNWKECTKMWNERENLIGKLATVKYFNLTPDGVPRFPYVIKIDRESYEG